MSSPVARRPQGTPVGGQFATTVHDEGDVELERPQPVPPFTVHEIIDTRDLIEVGEKFVRIPGTGEANECDRCGRLHEVHAKVTDSAGDSFVVGVGCMDSDAAKSARRLASRTEKAAVAMATEDRRSRARAELAELTGQVGPLEFPATDVVEHDTSEAFGPAFSVGDVRVFGRAPRPNPDYYRPGGFETALAEFREERRRVLEHTWQERELTVRLEAIVGSEKLAALRKYAR